jgi:hypothetical protein
MARTTLRALVFLACVAAFSCSGGDSNPTNPDTPPSGGGGGGGGGTGGGGGGGGTGATAIASDDVFDDNNWDAELQVFGNGGTGGASHVRFNGQEGADYRRISITANSAEGSGAATQVAVFSIRRGTAYFPSTDGEIFSISYSEDSILLSGGGNGQYSAPALRQNGKLYTLVPGGGAFATPELAWTPHSLSNLRQNDFRTLASASEHPDFSRTGTRIEVGFMRLHTVAAGGPGGTRLGGIDNWRLTFVR